MSITREQVADLQPGDVVDYRRDEWPEGAFVRSPLHASEFDKGLYVLEGQFGVRTPDGRPYERMATLTVVSRAPRPLYVNSDRTEPVDGDIIRDCDGDAWLYRDGEWFVGTAEDEGPDGPEYFKPLNLLWNGETGQVVQ